MIEIDKKKYLSSKELAQKYGYSASWVKLKREQHEGPPFVRITKRGRILYPMDKAEIWFETNTQIYE